MNVEQSAELRRPFPPETIGQLPRGNTKLDFVGHAAVTDRLLSVDPEWNWEPLALDEHGLPARDAEGALWIKLTVCGVTRLGVSDPGDTNKVAIGDAIRNGAMRFGVALDLWSKDDLESQIGESPRRLVRQTAGAPQTPGDHEDQRSRALIASHTKRWAEAGEQWRVDELKRRRDAAGWPQALLEYDRTQLARAVAEVLRIDKLDGPDGPQEPQDGPGGAQLALDGAGGADQQGEGVAVAPTAGDVSTRSDAVSSAEPAAAPKPAGRRKT